MKEELNSSLSIIIISKDDPHGLRHSLSSIEFLEDAQIELEIIVVVAGLSLAASQSLRNVVRIQDTGLGIANALNCGIAAATKRWLMFLNGGDALLGRTAFLKCWAALNEADIYSFQAVVTDRQILIPRKRPRNLFDNLYISHQASFFSRSLFETFGGYSSRFKLRMDLEFMSRIVKDVTIHHEPIQLVEFAFGGVSSVNPIRSSIEETVILCRAGFYGRAISILAAYLPFRMARHFLRVLEQKAKKRNSS